MGEIVDWSKRASRGREVWIKVIDRITFRMIEGERSSSWWGLMDWNQNTVGFAGHAEGRLGLEGAKSCCHPSRLSQVSGSTWNAPCQYTCQLGPALQHVTVNVSEPNFFICKLAAAAMYRTVVIWNNRDLPSKNHPADSYHFLSFCYSN
jgi:hypothetical protein